MIAKLSYKQPLLQTSVSCDPSEIVLIWWFAQETLLLLSISLLSTLKQLQDYLKGTYYAPFYKYVI